MLVVVCTPLVETLVLVCNTGLGGLTVVVGGVDEPVLFESPPLGVEVPPPPPMPPTRLVSAVVFCWVVLGLASSGAGLAAVAAAVACWLVPAVLPLLLDELATGRVMAGLRELPRAGLVTFWEK